MLEASKRTICRRAPASSTAPHWGGPCGFQQAFSMRYDRARGVTPKPDESDIVSPRIDFPCAQVRERRHHRERNDRGAPRRTAALDRQLGTLTGHTKW